MKHLSREPLTRRFAIGLTVLAWLGAPAAPVGQTPNPPYLAEMPTAERVRREIRGADEADTLARQAAAVQRLPEIIQIAAGDRYHRQRLTSDENALMVAYAQEGGRIMREAEALLGMNSRGFTQWMNARQEYRADPAFFRALLETFFSPEFRQGLAEGARSADAWRAANPIEVRRPSVRPWSTTMSDGDRAVSMQVGGICLLLLALSAFRETRRFGFDTGDPHRLRAGFGSRHVNWFTGTVSSFRHHTLIRKTRSWNLVRRSADPDLTGWKESVWESKEPVHDFALVRGSDRQEWRNVPGTLVFKPEGHTWSAAWVEPKGLAKETALFFVAHHTTGTSNDRPLHVIETIVRPKVRGLPATVLGYIVGYAIDPLGGWIGTAIPFLSGMALALMGFSAVVLVNRAIGRVRARRFEHTEIPRLLLAIERQMDQEGPPAATSHPPETERVHG